MNDTARPDEQWGVIHVHSAYSADGNDSLESLREFGVMRGLRFIGLTDHAEDFTQERFREFLNTCEKLSDEVLRLYPGLEFRFAGHPGLHLLALNLRSWISPETPAAFIKQALGACDLTVLAHPLLTGYDVPPEIAEAIDAVEVWNATYNTRFLPDVRAIRLYQTLRHRRPELLALVGLDQHDCGNYREVRIVVHGAGETAPFQLLRDRAYVNVGKTMRFGPDVGWGPLTTRAWSMVRWMFDHVERIQDGVARARSRRKQ